LGYTDSTSFKKTQSTTVEGSISGKCIDLDQEIRVSVRTNKLRLIFAPRLSAQLMKSDNRAVRHENLPATDFLLGISVVGLIQIHARETGAQIH